MNQKKLYKIFIWGFSALYLFVAGISFCHAIQFFNIGNNYVMSIMLALAFEVGLALSLVAILLSDSNRKNALPWILMIVLTAVQVIGNVYSVFKYISLSGEDYYMYLQRSLLFFVEDVDQNTVQVIISWIMGAILPIIALFMTDMVANNVKSMNSSENDSPVVDNAPNCIHSFTNSEPLPEIPGANDKAMKSKNEDKENQHIDLQNVIKSQDKAHKDDEKKQDVKKKIDSGKKNDAAPKPVTEPEQKRTKMIKMEPKRKVDDHYYETYEQKKK